MVLAFLLLELTLVYAEAGITHHPRFTQIQLKHQARVSAFAQALHEAATHQLLGSQNPLNGQVGIEAELQHSPRVMLYNPTVKDNDGKFSYLRYGQTIAETENGLIRLTIDNEKVPLSGSALTYWMGMYKKNMNYLDNSKDLLVQQELSSDLYGRDVAIEIVTEPIDTDDEKAQTRVQVVLRKLFEQLNLFAKGTTKSTSTVIDSDGQKLFDKVFAASIAKKKPKLLDLTDVIAAYNTQIQSLAKNDNTYSKYKLQAPFFHAVANTAAATGWKYLLAFPPGVQVTPNAPQLNVGVPLVNLAKGTVKKGTSPEAIVGPSATYTSSLKAHKYIKQSFSRIQTLAVEQLEKWIQAHVDPKLIPAKSKDLDDLRGLWVALHYYSLLVNYMGNSSKNVHNFLIKAPLPDIIRHHLFQSSSRTVLAALWQEVVDKNQLTNLAKEIYASHDSVYTSHIQPLKYPKSVQSPDAIQQKIEKTIKLLLTFRPSFARFLKETTTGYGTGLDADIDYDFEDLSDNAPRPLCPAGSPIAPFEIKKRVAVLIENRLGGAPFNQAWTKFNEGWLLPSFRKDALDPTTKLQSVSFRQKPWTPPVRTKKTTPSANTNKSLGPLTKVQRPTKTAKFSNHKGRRKIKGKTKKRTLKEPRVE